MTEFVKDSMINLMTGKGTLKDRESHNQWDRNGYNRELLSTLYAENWIARRCVDVPADEAVSKWREIDTPSMTPEQKDEFSKAEKALKIKKKIGSVVKWSRLFGGGALYFAVEGQNIEDVLGTSRVRKGAKFNVVPFSRNEIQPMTDKIDLDEFSPGFGMPVYYRIRKTGKVVHASRLCIFSGPCEADPDSPQADDRYWGRSIFDSTLISAIERCETAMGALTTILDKANADYLKIPELFQRLADTESTARLRSRIAEGSHMLSVYKLGLVDSSEELIRTESAGSLTGGKDIVQMLLQVPAGATGIPATKLLGVSPGGLNATGESDLENYYGMLDEIRNDDIAEALEKFDKILCASLFGRTFDDWGLGWPSLWSADKTEESIITTNRIAGIVNLVQTGILPEEIALRQIYEDGIYGALNEEDVRAFEDFQVEEPEEVPTEPEAEEKVDDLENLGGVTPEVAE